MSEKISYRCFNHRPFRDTMMVQDGYYMTGDTRIPKMVKVPFRMSRECEYSKTDLGKADARCVGCDNKATNEPERTTAA